MSLSESYQQSINQINADNLSTWNYQDLLKNEFPKVYSRLYSSRLLDDEIDFVQKHADNQKLIKMNMTSAQGYSQQKKLFQVIRQELEKNIDDRSLQIQKKRKIGMIIMAIGIVLFVVSMALNFMNHPLNESNDVVRFFIPLLLIYIGTVIEGRNQKQLIFHQNEESLIRFKLFKRRSFLKGYHLLSIDDEKIYVSQDGVSAYLIEDSTMKQQLIDWFIQSETDNKELMTYEKSLWWFYDN